MIHLLIDIWKIFQQKNTIELFLIDQLVHLLSLTVIWLILVNGWSQNYKSLLGIYYSFNHMALVLGYVIILWPSGILVRELIAKWRVQLEDHKEEGESLSKAGMWIGFLERLLALTFILINQYAALGFLIAAKSILRLNPSHERKTRMYTEYVLVGTLLSFTIALFVGLILNYLF
jgi:hypothetical protein